MKKTIFFLFFLSLLFLLDSCKQEEEGFKPVYCSPDAPYAPCKNSNEICYKGNCIDKNLKCGQNIDAPCDNGDECRRDEETGAFKCFEGKCSKKNPDGYCLKEDETCYHGYCKKPCSPQNPHGGCENPEETCYDNTCLPKNDLCKRDNFNGKCNENNLCRNINGVAKCVEKCHKMTLEEKENGKTYENMPCPNQDETCIDGECLHTDNLCSKDNPDGECPTGKTCQEQENHQYTCEFLCSEEHKNGICLAEDQKCVDGTCIFQCSTNHPDGYCPPEITEKGGACEGGTCKLPCGDPEIKENTDLNGYCEGVKWCKAGNCVNPCDIEHKQGECRNEDDYCNNGICQKMACSEQFPNGYCSEDENGKERRCLNYTCVGHCAQSEPNGWCEEGKFCYQGSCKTPDRIPCGEPNGMYCTNRDYECIGGECIIKPCAPGFNGRCENEDEICYTPTGECFNMCNDYRRIICKPGESPEQNGCINLEDMPQNSTFGACCKDNRDCLSAGESISTPDNNRCTDDGNSIGGYCNKIGPNTCSEDSDCNDPYPYLSEEGNQQIYFCSSFNDLEENTNISYCERAKENCSAQRNKMEGQACNEACGDADCLYGLHCIDGICTNECENNDTCISISDKPLECKLYAEIKNYPGFNKKITAKICRNTCKSNKDCKLSQNECNNYYNRSDLNDNNTPFFSTCGNKKTGKPKNSVCDNDEECSSRLCVKNKCTEPCFTHEDCGNSAYCDFDRALTTTDGKKINFIGTCKYLARGTSRKNECTSKADCPDDTPVVNNINRHYKCLPYTDSTNTLRGICGIRDITNGVISEEGEACHAPNQFCDTGVCLDTRLEITNTVGSCKEICSETDECPQTEFNGTQVKQICKRVKFRDGTPQTNNNQEVFGSVCVPAPLSSLQNCKTSKCTLNNETCILNPVNKHENINKPWKFSVEYLCVAKNNNGRAFGADCTKDSDCETNLCSILTNKCTVACTTNSQCQGLGNQTCNTNYPAVYDMYQNNWVLGGVCE